MMESLYNYGFIDYDVNSNLYNPIYMVDRHGEIRHKTIIQSFDKSSLDIINQLSNNTIFTVYKKTKNIFFIFLTNIYYFFFFLEK